MARNTWATHLRDRADVQLKKYLYALRPLTCCSFVIEHRAMPPTLFAEVLAACRIPEDVRCAIDELVLAKSQKPELGTESASTVLNRHISTQMDSLGERLGDIPGRSVPVEELNALILSCFED